MSRSSEVPTLLHISQTGVYSNSDASHALHAADTSLHKAMVRRRYVIYWLWPIREMKSPPSWHQVLREYKPATATRSSGYPYTSLLPSPTSLQLDMARNRHRKPPSPTRQLPHRESGARAATLTRAIVKPRTVNATGQYSTLVPKAVRALTSRKTFSRELWEDTFEECLVRSVGEAVVAKLSVQKLAARQFERLLKGGEIHKAGGRKATSSSNGTAKQNAQQKNKKTRRRVTRYRFSQALVDQYGVTRLSLQIPTPPVTPPATPSPFSSPLSPVPDEYDWPSEGTVHSEMPHPMQYQEQAVQADISGDAQPKMDAIIVGHSQSNGPTDSGRRYSNVDSDSDTDSDTDLDSPMDIERDNDGPFESDDLYDEDEDEGIYSDAEMHEDEFVAYLERAMLAGSRQSSVGFGEPGGYYAAEGSDSDEDVDMVQVAPPLPEGPVGADSSYRPSSEPVRHPSAGPDGSIVPGATLLQDVEGSGVQMIQDQIRAPEPTLTASGAHAQAQEQSVQTYEQGLTDFLAFHQTCMGHAAEAVLEVNNLTLCNKELVKRIEEAYRHHMMAMKALLMPLSTGGAPVPPAWEAFHQQAIGALTAFLQNELAQAGVPNLAQPHLENMGSPPAGPAAPLPPFAPNEMPIAPGHAPYPPPIRALSLDII